MKQISEKEKINRVKLSEAYAEFDAITDRVCSGCGYNDKLSHSHIISRSRNKDLEADINNIVYDCLQRADGSEGCHTRWESMNIDKMRTLIDFDDRLEYIKKNDIRLWNLIMLKESQLKSKSPNL